jgi:hypothetical protein
VSDDLISKFIRPAGVPSRVGKATANETCPAGDEGRDFAARPFMLDLVMLDGSRHAFPYAHLLRAHLDPSCCIELFFATHTVAIRGRSLESLYEELVAYAVPRVVAVGERYDAGEGKQGAEQPVVHRIDVQRVGLGADDS